MSRDRILRLAWLGAVIAVVLFTALPLSALADAPGEGAIDLGNTLSPIQQWQYILSAFVFPFVTSVLIKNKYSERVQSLIMVAVCMIGTIGTMHFNGDLAGVSAENLFTKVMFCVIATGAMYKLVWKPTGVAPALQDKINP